MQNMIVENARVMARGQITLPKDIRERIGVGTGDKIALVCEGDKVTMMNAAVYAMRVLQQGMEGEWEKAGIYSDEDIMNLVSEVRNEIEGR